MQQFPDKLTPNLNDFRKHSKQKRNLFSADFAINQLFLTILLTLNGSNGKRECTWLSPMVPFISMEKDIPSSSYSVAEYRNVSPSFSAMVPEVGNHI